MSAFNVTDLVVNRVGLPVVRQASLVVEPGSVSVLLGANGAGKTTLLEGLSGVIAVAGGTIELLGEASRDCGPARGRARGSPMSSRAARCSAMLTTDENLRSASQRADARSGLCAVSGA